MSNGTVNSCSGVFYDSGGNAGNYSNSESFVFTICPDGGTATGSNTSIEFISWSVQPGTADVLSLYDGDNTTAPLITIGNGANSLAGQIYTASGASGCLTFEWVSNASGTAPGWEVDILTGPSAGQSQVTTVCNDVGIFDLFTLLGGTPDVGGVWTDPSSAPHTNFFNPLVDPAGIWSYTVSGGAGCNDAVATITISLVTAADAGTDGLASFCETDATASLFSLLGGTPDLGGSWTGPGGAHSGVLDPATDGSGLYTYTVIGTPPCVNATAVVVVTVSTAPYAGLDGSTTVCSDDAPFNLFALLTGGPDVGGVWIDPHNDPHPATYTPGVSVPGIYTYFLVAQAPCVDASSTVTINESQATDAGISDVIAVCSDDAPFNMFLQLGGVPDAGGAWTFGGNPVSGTFDPTTDPAGVYTYTVSAQVPCVDAVSTLEVTVNPFADAGTSTTVNVCSDAPSFQLIDELGGTPQTIGSWEDPNNDPHSGTFTPGTSVGGAYTYTVQGVAPCTDAVSTVTVIQTTAADAGSNASIVVCSDAVTFDLFDELGGSPDLGGTWEDPDGNAYSDPFDASSDIGGIYTYTVSGSGPCNDDASTVFVTVNQAPNAGTSALTVVCSDQASFDLLTILTGSPDIIGSWTDPNNDPFAGIFDPLNDLPGIYTYTVLGIAPCNNDISTVEVSITDAPEAGLNGSLTVCSDGPIVPLFTHLGGLPDNGGQWYRPNGSSFNGNYDPATGLGGTYVYVVLGTGPCDNDTANVTIIHNISPRAGTDGTITVCSTQGLFDLFTILGGNPMSSGTWLDPSGTAFPSGDFVPGVSTPGLYTYVVAGIAPCVNDSAVVEVVVNIAPEAGTSVNLSICGNDAPFNLFDELGGSPDAGGTWEFNSNPHSVIYDPVFDGTGVYVYTVGGTAPCADASSSVIVLEVDPVTAGTSVSIDVCESDPPLVLFGELGGSPDLGGVWQGPGGAFAGVFDPTSNVSGDYDYTVLGTAPCLDSTATVAITLLPSPLSGDPGTLSVCPDVPQIDLFNVLGGSYDLGGTWVDNTPTGQLAGSIFSPNGLATGNYTFTYTVNGNGNCSDQSTTVTIMIVAALDAGQNSSVVVCGSEQSYLLFGGLNGTPQSGGTWSDDDNTNALTAGILNASSLASGVYDFTYLLAGSLGCNSDSATLSVTVVDEPEPGVDDNYTVCSSAPAFNMTAELAGSPAGNGFWLDASLQAHSNVYNPALVADASGVYTYVVSGIAPCLNDSAFLTITEIEAPFAGDNNTVTLCSNTGAFTLLDSLLGAPDITGVWTDPSSNSHSGTFFPGSDPSGPYIYEVAGTFPCANDIAILNVQSIDPPNPGSSTSVTFCSSDAPVLLISYLPTADVSGTWEDPDGNSFGGVFVPNSSDQGVYTYTVLGSSGCADESATVTVFVNQEADAGSLATETVCVNSGSVNLFLLLGGTPQAGGTWTDPNGQPHSGQFIASNDLAGAYQYLVLGILPCPADSAVVNISVTPEPNAGTSTLVPVCNNALFFYLFDSLGGNPDIGGFWTDPNSALTSGFYIPGSPSPGPGTYTYTVLGNGLCADASATVTVIESAFASAGFPGAVNVCETDGSLDLFQSLTGSPDAGGIWLNPNGFPHSGTFVPSSDTPGNYQYVNTGPAPCPSDNSFVTVHLDTVPDAGIGGILNVCDNENPFAMITGLGGDPDLTGFWVGPAPTNPLSNGIYSPGISDPGTYTYTVSANQSCPAVQSQLTITENSAAEAGDNSAKILCSANVGGGGTFNVIDHMDGDPDAGGFWLDPAGLPFNGQFVSGLSADGLYTYIVPGLFPCVNDSATIDLSVTIAPDAGINSAQTLCSGSSTIQLISLLLGTPDSTGVWFGPDSLLHGPLFDPAVHVPGTYTYYVSANFPCTDVTSTVQISLVPSAEAGMNGGLTTCTSDNAFDLSQGLSGADPGGIWLDLSPSGALSGSFVDATSLSPGVYDFAYVVLGGGSCDNDTAFMELTVTVVFDAGDDAAKTVCESEGTINLFQCLGPDAQAGGIWTDTDASGCIGIPFGLFDPACVTPNTFWAFTYVISGSGGCASDSAQVVIFVEPGPDAGGTGALSTCETGQPFSLFDLVPGADAGGQWFNSDWTLLSTDSIFPFTDTSDVFHYIVPGVGNCGPDTAVATVVISPSAHAGDPYTEIFVCSDDFPFNMFDSIAGNPDPGGTWGTQGCTVPFGLTFNPAIDLAGQYCYIIPGTGSCPSATAILEINVDPAPDAGCDGVLDICSSDPSVLLFFELSCSPDLSGQWYDPLMNAHGGTLDPFTDTSGVYIYVVLGSGGCENDTSQVSVDITEAANAGISTVVDTCALINSLNLFDLLGGDPDVTGTWVGPVGTSIIGDTLIVAGLPVDVYIFSYTVSATSPCADSVATVTVDFTSGGANAGGSGLVTTCSTLGSLDLSTITLGAADPGGIWTMITGAPACLQDSILDLSCLAADSTYNIIYVVTEPGCGADTAFIDLEIVEGPSVGQSITLDICVTDSTFNIFDQLGGSADSTGFWIGPLGNTVTPIYVPGVSKEGVYYYIIAPLPPCPLDTAVVLINEWEEANAGFDAYVSGCSGAFTSNLLGWLGTPDASGTWFDLDNTGNITTDGIFSFDSIAAGLYGFEYVVSNAGCGSDTAVATVNVIFPIEVENLSFECDMDDWSYTATFDILAGDSSSYTISGGNGTLIPGSPYSYVTGSYPLYDPLQITISDGFGCGNVEIDAVNTCDFGSLVFVPQSFSPNGDGINDYFEIQGIEGFPNNVIRIYNRWGDLIYDQAGYNNGSVKWAGAARQALFGEEAPAGTYYYVLDLGVEGSEIIRGYVYLNK